ncbi:MAG: glycosyltransferase [Rhodobacteraceae bacterium]|nr:glycosyltransferase [Paracoccaceae bacterium]
MTQDPLRIIHIVRSPIGGIFRHIHDLALSQVADGHKVGLICDSTTGSDFDNLIVDELAAALPLGVERVAMRREITPKDVTAIRQIYKHVSDIKPDVLHGHGAKGGVYARLIGTALRFKGQKTLRIYCPHGGSLHYDPNRIEGKIYHTLERLLSRITDGTIFVSDYEYSAFESKVCKPRTAARIVYNGLKPEEFEPVEVPETADDFLYIGMLRDLKGTDLFLEALYNLKLTRGVAPTAHIVGEGPDEQRYRDMVVDFGLEDTVTFHGALPAREAFTLAKCVVVPSRAEAMPYIVLEAIAAERPLIATRVGGIPEIFGRYSPRLVTPGDAKKLTFAMEAALEAPGKMVDAAVLLRRCLAETFSVDLMNDRIFSLYQDARYGPATDSRPSMRSAPTSPNTAGALARRSER